MTTSETAPREVGPVFSTLIVYQRWADSFSEWTGKLAAWMVIPTVAVGFVNVVLRYTGQLMGRRLTSNALIETQLYLYSAIFLLGFAYVLKHHINVRVDFWFANQQINRRAWIDYWGNWIALIPFCIIGIWVSFPQAWQSLKVWEMSPDASGLPRGPIKALLALAFLLLLLQAIAEQIKLYAILTDRAYAIEIEETEEPIRIE